MFDYGPNELHPELISTAAFNIAPGSTSGSRLQMVGVQLTQALVVKGATPRRIVTGVEREYGKLTFKVQMPCDAEVLAIVQKYPETIGQHAIAFNPLTVVIYEDSNTHEIGILELPKYHVKHQYFGFQYKYKNSISRLSKGAYIPKGTVFADSPSIDDHGDYCYGVETEVAFMTVPDVIEDGVVVSESYAKKLMTLGYETHDASWGKKYYPLNLYGDDTLYKPFPDIGERVRPDGLLFALRRYDELLDPINMTPAALRRVDMLDKKIYTKANARVVDVVARYDPKGMFPDTPTGMEEQAKKYYQALLNFYTTIEGVYHSAQRKYRENLKISREFHKLLTEALLFKIDNSKVKATRMVQRQPLDEWRVDVMVEYDIHPTKAFKLTGLSGDKGVICAVWPDEHMPVDKHGRRADVIVDGGTTLNRVNPSRTYEQELNATSDQVCRELKAILAHGQDDVTVGQAFARVLRYYQIVSPLMYRTLMSEDYFSQYSTPAQAQLAHLQQILSDPHGLRLFLPTNNEAAIPNIMEQLYEEFPIDVGPVSYVGKSGRKVLTVENIMIGSMYMMLLEKTGNDWSSVSSGTLQQFGILTKLTRHDKNSRPGRASPTRTMGEDEVRLVAAVTSKNTTAQALVPQYGPAAADGLAVAELMDLANNPITHAVCVSGILHAAKPTNIERLVDRAMYPRGGSRGLEMVKHHLEVGGMRLTWEDDLEETPMIYKNELMPMEAIDELELDVEDESEEE